MRMNILRLAVIATLFALPAQAYVGPGLGLGAIGVVAGLLLSLVMAFFAFVWLPIKKLFSRNKPLVEEGGDEG